MHRVGEPVEEEGGGREPFPLIPSIRASRHPGVCPGLDSTLPWRGQSTENNQHPHVLGKPRSQKVWAMVQFTVWARKEEVGGAGKRG